MATYQVGTLATDTSLMNVLLASLGVPVVVARTLTHPSPRT